MCVCMRLYECVQHTCTRMNAKGAIQFTTTRFSSSAFTNAQNRCEIYLESCACVCVYELLCGSVAFECTNIKDDAYS